MVRQAHHDRLDLPLVLRLVEGCAPFKSFEAYGSIGSNSSSAARVPDRPGYGRSSWGSAKRLLIGSIAVGSLAFVEKVKGELGVKATHRKVVQRDETYALREPSETYGGEVAGENDGLRVENTISWEKNAARAL
jgi:hypothetical protein